MSASKVTHYTTTMTFGDAPNQLIQLYSDNQQIGSLNFTNAALFNATIDMLRNETTVVSWDAGRKQLGFALQPVGEGEPG